MPLTLYGQDIRLAYMDVAPQGTPNGRTVVLFHGMNFAGFYWGGPIDALRKEGYRVVVPDQIGFGRSSKPIMPGPNRTDQIVHRLSFEREFRLMAVDR